jgi:hypothetical protein
LKPPTLTRQNFSAAFAGENILLRARRAECVFLRKPRGELISFAKRLRSGKPIILLPAFSIKHLLVCLIESVPFESNITGTYGAFLKTWDKKGVQTQDTDELKRCRKSGQGEIRDTESYMYVECGGRRRQLSKPFWWYHAQEIR